MGNLFIPNSKKIHIAIIPDGGRRWAKLNNYNYEYSYKITLNKISEIMNLLFEKNVSILSVYFSSIHNFKRPQEEINSFCKPQAHFINTELTDFAVKNEIQVKVFGEKKSLPEYMQTSIENVEKITNKYNNRKIYLFINYSSILEIQNNKLFNFIYKGELINIAEPVNILIRTGGANVLSDFLLLQNAFSRIYFLDELFNDLDIKIINDIYGEYLNLSLKYGE